MLCENAEQVHLVFVLGGDFRGDGSEVTLKQGSLKRHSKNFSHKECSGDGFKRTTNQCRQHFKKL